MSWLNWASTSSTRSNNPNFTEAARQERRAKLKADRVLRNQRKADRQKFFQAGISAPPSPISLSKSGTPQNEPIDEVQSLPDIFFISEDVFDDYFKMVNFNMRDEENEADAMKNMGQIKIKWKPSDPEFFFTQFETELEIFGIKKQFTKRQALIRSLPEDVAEELKHLIVLQQDAAGNTPYKNLKTALIKAYGPKPQEAFQRALNRVMVGKPLALLKLLVSDICKKSLSDCCCATTVWGLFQSKIPMYLKTD